jgi:formate C-acetyltransferase
MAAPAAKGSAPTSTPFSGAKEIADPMTMGGPSPRVQKKLAAFVNIQPEVCVERALLVTKAYQETEGLPVYVRRAHALETVLDNMTIFIGDDELIVGNQCSKPRSAPIFPEFSCEWIEPEMDTMAHRDGDAFLISEENKARPCGRFSPTGGERQTTKLATNMMPPECLEAMMAGVYTFGNYYYNGVGHISVDYRKVLEKGLNGIIAEAADAKAKLDVADAEDLRKCHFLSSVITSCKAVIRFAARFAAEAEKQAAACSNPVRSRTGEIARNLPQGSPRSPRAASRSLPPSWWFNPSRYSDRGPTGILSPGASTSTCTLSLRKDPPFSSKGSGTVLLFSINGSGTQQDPRRRVHQGFGGFPLFQNMIVGGVERKVVRLRRTALLHLPSGRQTRNSTSPPVGAHS